MKDFFLYFFGEGQEPEFSLFTFAHFLPILLAIGVILLIYWKREAIAACKHEETIRYVLAITLILTDMSYYWRLVGYPSLEHGPVENLPIGICAWSVILASYMVVGKKQSFFDIVYFWLLTCSFLRFSPLLPLPLPVLPVSAITNSG